MMDFAIALALETAAPVPVRRRAWITRHEDSSRDTSLPEDLAVWFLDDSVIGTHSDAERVDAETAVPAEAKSDDVFSVLDRFTKLGDDWNGDRAVAPAPVAISNAGLAALQLEARGLKPTITADVDGGLMLTLHHPKTAGRFAALSCDNEGDTYLILEAPPEPPFVRQVDDAEGVGSATLDEIQQFLSR